MDDGSVLERLRSSSPGAEIWLDFSPLLYPLWCRRALDNAPPERRARWQGQLARLFDPDEPRRSLIAGATTNPRLLTNVLFEMADCWPEYIHRRVNAQPGLGAEELYRRLYRALVAASAGELAAMWEQTGGRYGWVSGQLDPRLMQRPEAMLQQGLELAELAPNVMVKVPGNRPGYEVIEELTARGISTNNTFAYSVPQFLACVRAVDNGRRRARAAGLHVRPWRSVITHMIGRFGGQGDLLQQAADRGVRLSKADVRWAELLVFKRIHQIVRDNRPPTKMLLSSMQLDDASEISGAVCWHLQKTAGAEVVYTCTRPLIEGLMARESELPSFDPKAIDEQPPAWIINKLLKLPEFRAAYEPDGIEPDGFDQLGAFVHTAAEAVLATRRMLDFVVRHAEQARELQYARPPRRAGEFRQLPAAAAATEANAQ